MTSRTKSRWQLPLGGFLMAVGAYIALPYGSMWLFDWPWLFRFGKGTVTIWNLLTLDNAGFTSYQKIVFAVGLPLAALGTLLVVLGRLNADRVEGRRL